LVRRRFSFHLLFTVFSLAAWSEEKGRNREHRWPTNRPCTSPAGPTCLRPPHFYLPGYSLSLTRLLYPLLAVQCFNPILLLLLLVLSDGFALFHMVCAC
jgi:hypothetical protein